MIGKIYRSISDRLNYGSNFQLALLMIFIFAGAIAGIYGTDTDLKLYFFIGQARGLPLVLLSELVFVIAILIMGVSAAGMVFVPFVLFFKAYCISAQTCCLVETGGLPGFLDVLTNVFVPNLIIFPAMIYLTLISVNFSCVLLTVISGKKSIRNVELKRYCFSFLAAGCIILSSAFAGYFISNMLIT